MTIKLYCLECDEIVEAEEGTQPYLINCEDHKITNQKNIKQSKKAKCIYCNNFLNIDNFAGISKKGLFCDNISCINKHIMSKQKNGKVIK